MKIALDVLRRFVDLPEPFAEARGWLDRCGLEVKRATPPPAGALGGQLTLELLANRGDHHCYEGIARELSARLDRDVRLPDGFPLSPGDGPHPVSIETPLALRYALVELVRTGPEAPLSAAALQVLEAAGQQPVSAAVDATNVANLELGQPTHAFDADTIRGPITLRTSREGERAWPLFRPEPVPVPPGTLVVADDEKILAIAGVIGCEESKTTDATRRILLESATFDPVAVRKAARALGIATDSSARFERGADPERVLPGAGRVARLLVDSGAWAVGACSLSGSWSHPGRVISFTLGQAVRALGRAIEPADVQRILARQGFKVRAEDGTFHARVPAHRLWDVAFSADLWEELAKGLGYESFVPTLPPVSRGALPSPAEVARRVVDDVLVGSGFYEVFTDGFHGRNARELLGLTEAHPLWRFVETTNALDRAYSFLKNNGLHQALEAVAANERRKVRDVALFEWCRTFHPWPDELPPGATLPRTVPPCVERPILWLAAAGRDRPPAWVDRSRPADTAWLRGLVHELSVALGVDLEISAADATDPLTGLLHPGRRGAIWSAGRRVGIYGEVHPEIVKNYRIKHLAPVYLEIEQSALFAEGRRPPYVEPSPFQPVTRAVAFSLPPGVEAGSIAAVLDASGPDWLERVAVTDLFELPGAAGAPGPRAVTFSLEYAGDAEGQAGVSSRSAEDVNAVTAGLVSEVLRQFGPVGVQQR